MNERVKQSTCVFLKMIISFNFQGKEEEFTRAQQCRREAMSVEAPVGVARVLAAKDDLLVVEKTSGEKVRKQTQSELNKVIIGKASDVIVKITRLLYSSNLLIRYRIVVDVHKRHAHLQKCRHSRREQSHQKIKEGVGPEGVAKAEEAEEVVVVEGEEEEYKEVCVLWSLL